MATAPTTPPHSPTTSAHLHDSRATLQRTLPPTLLPPPPKFLRPSLLPCHRPTTAPCAPVFLMHPPAPDAQRRLGSCSAQQVIRNDTCWGSRLAARAHRHNALHALFALHALHALFALHLAPFSTMVTGAAITHHPARQIVTCTTVVWLWSSQPRGLQCLRSTRRGTPLDACVACTAACALAGGQLGSKCRRQEAPARPRGSSG